MSETICIINIPHSVSAAIMDGTFQPEPLPDTVEGPYELTPAQSISRFLNNPDYNIELVPAQHFPGRKAPRGGKE